MREFYRQLASGADKAQALRQAKLKMIQQFGPEAVPRLWSWLVMYGDAAGSLNLKARRGSRSTGEWNS
jgi:CHAT domain-containing protein